MSDSDFTIDSLIKENWHDDASRALRIRQSDILYGEGKQRFGALAPTMRTKSASEYRFGGKYAEAQRVSYAILASGRDITRMVPRERPDFAVALADGVLLGIEDCEIVTSPSARTSNTRVDLDVELNDRIEADPDLKAALHGHHISIMMDTTPPSGKKAAIVDELCRFIRELPNGELPEREILSVAECYRLLSVHGTEYYHAAAEYGYVTVSAGANSFSGTELVTTIFRQLAVKRKKAVGYEMRPLWLVMTVSDEGGVYGSSVHEARKLQPAIDPFERVLIQNLGSVTELPRPPVL